MFRVGKSGVKGHGLIFDTRSSVMKCVDVLNHSPLHGLRFFLRLALYRARLCAALLIRGSGAQARYCSIVRELDVG